MRNVLNTLFHRQARTAVFVHLDRHTGQPEATSPRAALRRIGRTVVQQIRSRIAQIVTAGGSRTHKSERAVQRQEKAVWHAVDQHLDAILQDVRSKRPATAQRACEEVIRALHTIPSKTSVQPDPLALRCGECLLQKLRDATHAELVAMRDVLAEHVKGDSHPVMKLLKLAVSSELLRHKLASLNLAEEGPWALPPMDIDLMSHQQRLDVKALRDLASALILRAPNLDNRFEQTALPGIGYTQAALKDVAAFGEKAVAKSM
ncbi:hypothetical protein [Hydrogenophaga sp. BPS33]|uniref:hypothetical protein n=1 Tax=Hydrogenophaga sp. BPS33 TaxID=2651974 RepID=UPI0013201FFF|nr:hypothetical protein [Hydrogenophaga sp. BPS33]QHE85178.1 hypothetical protein F9K07_09905 [Hydrogenophaga sp. BPS33]